MVDKIGIDEDRIWRFEGFVVLEKERGGDLWAVS